MLSKLYNIISSIKINRKESSNTIIKSFGPNLDKLKKHFNYDNTHIKRSLMAKNNLKARELNDNMKIAFNHIFKFLGYTENEFVVKNAYTTSHNGITHIYIKQATRGLEIANADLNINIGKSGDVISMGSSFYKKATNDSAEVSSKSKYQKTKILEYTNLQFENKNNKQISPKNKPRSSFYTRSVIFPLDSTYITLEKAVEFLAKYLGQKIELNGNSFFNINFTDANKNEFSVIKDIPIFFAEDGQILYKPVFIHSNNGTLEAAWNLRIVQKNHSWGSFVSAKNGQIISLISWTSGASYRVYPFEYSNPEIYNRTLLINPHNIAASPQGWHFLNNRISFNSTVGNNVAVQKFSSNKSLDSMYRPISLNNEYDYKINYTKNADTYIDASITNVFYTINMMHDLMYQYGFDEKAGNFQQDNRGKGGKGNDAVIAYVQDSSQINNAQFTTPPDGYSAKMNLFLFSYNNSQRDPSLVNDLIVHEYSHGVSSRLVGGPENADCLLNNISQGMGEGWSDFVAIFVKIKPGDCNTTLYTMCEYLMEGGFREYPYTTDIKKNPVTFGYLNKENYQEPHNSGLIWASILHEVLWALINKHGFTKDLMSRNIKYGNILALQLVIDAMKLHICNPNFIHGRDDIILSDEELTGGKNKCNIWKAFAKRGMGYNANIFKQSNTFKNKYIESFDLPKECF
ncbi:hypothetical protein BB561_006663 [Smittium simulii]|uniref:Extracellular metalloproteinase n=1 Tax=Smittium simulii TaxID=133385 RepID=A0A2T9Y2I0_9FUNG|nr:hypothetical protein BB561_006663 [Smittium simulii]